MISMQVLMSKFIMRLLLLAWWSSETCGLIFEHTANEQKKINNKPIYLDIDKEPGIFISRIIILSNKNEIIKKNNKTVNRIFRIWLEYSVNSLRVIKKLIKKNEKKNINIKVLYLGATMS